jgi:O-antigen ligase
LIEYRKDVRLMRKLLFLGISILVFIIYLIYSYNNLKGQSYVYETVYISLSGPIPENTELKLVYQTMNDPTNAQNANLITSDTIPANTHIFKIDSTHRLSNFSIYFTSLWEDEEITINQITASNDGGDNFSFSLKIKDLRATENISLEELNDGAIRIRKISYDKPIGTALYFNVRGSINGVFKRTDQREPEFPSALAFLAIFLLATGMAFSLYPLFKRLNWKGLSTGTYLLALAILIMPSGEKICNLILVLAIISGIIKILNEGSFIAWVKENQRVLILIFTISLIYFIALLIYGNDPSTLKLLRIKYGLPVTLFAVAINTNSRQEIRIQYAALVMGVIVSVFIHLGWSIMLIDAVEIKTRLLSDPRYYMESAVFSRVHHSYLSILYLASLIPILLKKDIIPLSRKEIIIFSVLIIAGLLFAFSRAAILSLLLILVYFSLKRIFLLLRLDITLTAKYFAASILTVSLIIIVFFDIKVAALSPDSQVKGIATRIEIWQNAAELIKQNPIYGWGPGRYKEALRSANGFTSYNSNTWRVLNTHNQFLETSGMFGLLVATGLAWFLLFPTGFSKQHSKYSDFIIAAAIIFITAFFFESFLNRNLGILVFGLSYGLIIKMKTIYDS